ncbi:unnamed protein product [Amoebophrya sp. A120]|nr:unnamed protein product [Amoebophrya sp. A120]|eukprot:GSA120T00023961001.1
MNALCFWFRIISFWCLYLDSLSSCFPVALTLVQRPLKTISKKKNVRTLVNTAGSTPARRTKGDEAVDPRKEATPGVFDRGRERSQSHYTSSTSTFLHKQTHQRGGEHQENHKLHAAQKLSGLEGQGQGDGPGSFAQVEVVENKPRLLVDYGPRSKDDVDVFSITSGEQDTTTGRTNSEYFRTARPVQLPSTIADATEKKVQPMATTTIAGPFLSPMEKDRMHSLEDEIAKESSCKACLEKCAIRGRMKRPAHGSTSLVPSSEPLGLVPQELLPDHVGETPEPQQMQNMCTKFQCSMREFSCVAFPLAQRSAWYEEIMILSPRRDHGSSQFFPEVVKIDDDKVALPSPSSEVAGVREEVAGLGRGQQEIVNESTKNPNPAAHHAKAYLGGRAAGRSGAAVLVPASRYVDGVTRPPPSGDNNMPEQMRTTGELYREPSKSDKLVTMPRPREPGEAQACAFCYGGEEESRNTRVQEQLPATGGEANAIGATANQHLPGASGEEVEGSAGQGQYEYPVPETTTSPGQNLLKDTTTGTTVNTANPLVVTTTPRTTTRAPPGKLPQVRPSTTTRTPTIIDTGSTTETRNPTIIPVVVATTTSRPTIITTAAPEPEVVVDNELKRNCARMIYSAGNWHTCRVARDECVIFQSGDVFTRCAGSFITVDGYLELVSNTQIEARRIHVSSSGKFVAGVDKNPVLGVENVRIILHHDFCGFDPHPRPDNCLQSGELMSEGGIVRLYGRPKTSWSLLIEDSPQWAKTMTVLACDNWQVGDSIVVAATGGEHLGTSGREAPEDSESEKKQLTKVDRIYNGPEICWSQKGRGTDATPQCSRNYCKIETDWGLHRMRRGKWIRDLIPLQAEVGNLSRGIVITGPFYPYLNHDPEKGSQGITTMQMTGWSGEPGAMEILHTRIENCGRRYRGSYCLHLHQVGFCARQENCRFVGNVVEDGTAKGITVHGTQNALVDQNVVVNVRGVSLYVEDGNEKNNVLSNNFLVCLKRANCRFENSANVKENVDSDFKEQSALYLLSPTNDIINNHIVGHENAFYVNDQGGHGGRGIEAAAGRICQQNLPYGRFEDNSFHNNNGFGWYGTNNHWPRKVRTDRNGFVSDWGSCLPFTREGLDNASPILVKNHFEAFNDFAAGTYSMGDITFENYVAFGNLKGFYWKTYRRGEGAGPFCRDCLFMANNQQMEGPGGSGHVEFVNNKFYTSAEEHHNPAMVVSFNHHCNLNNDEDTGGLCASHFDYRLSSFHGGTDWQTPQINFWSQHERGRARSDSLVLLHDRFLMSTDAARVFDTSRCRTQPAPSQGLHYCPRDLELRIVRIHSPDRGMLRVYNHDRWFDVPFIGHGKGWSGGAVTPGCWRHGAPSAPDGTWGSVRGWEKCEHNIKPQGYTFIVNQDAHLTLSFTGGTGNMEGREDVFVFEYAERTLEPVTQIHVTVQQNSPGIRKDMADGHPCTISSRHTRSLITAFGPINAAAGAWWECKRYWVKKDYATTFYDQAVKELQAR